MEANAQAGGVRPEAGGNPAPKEETSHEPQCASTGLAANLTSQVSSVMPADKPPPRTKPYGLPPACELFEQAEQRIADLLAQAPKEEGQLAQRKDLPDTTPTQAIVDGPKNLLLLGAETLAPQKTMGANQINAPS